MALRELQQVPAWPEQSSALRRPFIWQLQCVCNDGTAQGNDPALEGGEDVFFAGVEFSPVFVCGLDRPGLSGYGTRSCRS